MKENAPIVVFVYNRLDHAKAVLKSLSNCDLAKQSTIYIFSDGAKNEKAIESVAKVREFINSEQIKDWFFEVNVIESIQNKGLAKSVISGVDSVIRKSNKVIVVEDDNIVSKDFLVFMNDALNYYEKNLKIWCVGGYTLPIKFPKDYKEDVFLMGRGSSYAWATWIDRWEKIDWDIKDYQQFKQNKKLQRKFNAYGNDACYMLDRQMNKGIDSWAIRFLYNAFKNGQHFVLPVKSRVQNTGNDGSGIHVSQSDHRFDTKIENQHPKAIFKDVDIDSRIVKKYRKVFNISLKIKMKRFIKNRFKRG